ncbi:MAG: FecR domain-containing protein [Sphingobium sp.]
MLTREEQASAWCVRLATRHLSSSEQREFDSWMTSDSAHAQAFDQALLVWQGLHAISDSPEIIGQRVDALAAFRRANRRRWSQNLPLRWQWIARLGMGLAASFLLVCMLGWFVREKSPEIYASGIGERRAIFLADGSRLSLDADTRVSVLYQSNHRALTLLEGRAKFDVAKDRDRPFTVTAGGRTTIATGTAFSVELLSGQLHVILYEGHVEVMKGDPPPAEELLQIKALPGKAIGLSPGDELVTDLSMKAMPTVFRADFASSISWEDGQLSFVNEPLATAVEQLNRYSRTKIIIGDPRVASIRVNGVFNSGDSDAFLEAISHMYSLHVGKRGADFIVLDQKVKKSCEGSQIRCVSSSTTNNDG